MAFLTQTEITQSWILSKYSRYDFKSKSWTDLDSARCITPIKLSITPSIHLIINYETTIYECINLWNLKDNRNGVFKGNSLLVLHKNKDLVGKFRIKFLACDGKTAEEQCIGCVQLLRMHFPIHTHESHTKIMNDSILTLNDSILTNKNNINDYSNSNSLKSINSNDQQFSSLTLTTRDMAKNLLKQNEGSLPLLVDNDLNWSTNDSNLKEFIMCNLLDSTFSAFVEKVEYLLNDLISGETNSFDRS